MGETIPIARAGRKSFLQKARTADKQRTLDSYQNFAARIGVGTGNQSDFGQYGFNPITRNRILIEWIHRGSWLGGVAVDTVADDMTRAGVEIVSSLDAKAIKAIEDAATRMAIWSKISDTVKWARLYGGAIAVMLINGQDMSTPLRPETISKGQFKGLYVLDRWMLQPSFNEVVSEFGPALGMPKYYTVLTNAGWGVNAPINADGKERLVNGPEGYGSGGALIGQKIHHTRVLRMDGVKLPFQQKLTENLWGISVYERMYDRMLAFDSATMGISQMMFKTHLRTYKIKDLRDIIGGAGGDMDNLINWIALMTHFQGNEGMTLIDSEDDFQMHQQSMSGYDAVILMIAQQCSGSIGVPLVRLFGQSPAGLNSTGDSDIRLYYDDLASQQNRDMYNPVNTIYRVTAQSEGIVVGDDFEVKFKPLWQLSETEKSEISVKDSTYLGNMEGNFSPKIILEEAKKLSKLTGRGTTIQPEDITDAEDDLPPGPTEVQAAMVKAGAEEETGKTGDSLAKRFKSWLRMGNELGFTKLDI